MGGLFFEASPNQPDKARQKPCKLTHAMWKFTQKNLRNLLKPLGLKPFQLRHRRCSHRLMEEGSFLNWMIKELSKSKATELLSRCHYGHLGCILEDGRPYVVPINYIFLEGDIYGHTLPGMKLDAMRANRKVCLQAEEIKDSFRWQSAIAFGEFQEVKRIAERTRILQELSEKILNLTPVETLSSKNSKPGKAAIFRISIKEISGAAES